jgi:hypothetical protein
VRIPHRIRSVRRVPEGQELAFRQERGRVDFVLPRLEGHQMVELAF